ncbi:hypothetical protein TNCV_3303301 [Trichonephila clavipes]|nr:hypothetical protein TNCV_3303301 [Trichonephila clavipes]
MDEISQEMDEWAGKRELLNTRMRKCRERKRVHPKNWILLPKINKKFSLLPHGTVESTDTIVKLKTKIENSSTFESDPDFVKTLIKNCIDERVSRNEREVTLEKQKIELAKLQLAQLEKEVELQRAKNKALSLNPAAKVEEKQFETLNKETATHIGIREAEDWFRPIDLAKECDIYISSKNGSHCEKRFKPKESNDHIHNRINVNTLKVESEKQNSDEFANLQYVSIFVENQPVTALIDSGCQIPVLNSSLIRVKTPSEEIITLSSCFGEQRMVEVKPINISLDQHSPSLSVRTAISPTLTEEIIIHPSVYSEIKKLGHAKSDFLLNESESSLGAHAYAYPNVVSVSNVIENSSYDLPHVKNFNTRNDLSSLIKDYKYSPLVSMERKKGIRTAADSVQSEWPLWHAAKSKTQSSRAGAGAANQNQNENFKDFGETLTIRKNSGENARGGEQALPSAYYCQTYLPF